MKPLLAAVQSVVANLLLWSFFVGGLVANRRKPVGGAARHRA